VFTDLDFADDVALLAKMLEVLVLAMTIMQEEAAVWSSDKLVENQNITGYPSIPCSTVQVAQMDMLKWSTRLSIW